MIEIRIDKNKVARKIESLMKTRSYAGLASELGVSSGTLWRIMNKGGAPSLETVVKLQSLLNRPLLEDVTVVKR